MTHYLTGWSAKTRIGIALVVGLSGISTVADARAYACSCSFQDHGSSYDVAYVSEGGGCCNGNASNGSGFVDRVGNGPEVHGYVEGSFAQSLCCTPL